MRELMQLQSEELRKKTIYLNATNQKKSGMQSLAPQWSEFAYLASCEDICYGARICNRNLLLLDIYCKSG